MNHLAHFHLARHDAGLIAGALLADHVRGPLRGDWPAAIESGVRLHRCIDAFTDAHAEVLALRRHFAGPGRRLAGIVLDMHFDYWLTRHWRRFHDAPLADFVAGVHRVLDGAPLSAAARAHADRLREHELLQRYGDSMIIDGALVRIGERLGLSGPMSAAMATAHTLAAEIERGFLCLYPEALDRFSAGR